MMRWLRLISMILILVSLVSCSQIKRIVNPPRFDGPDGPYLGKVECDHQLYPLGEDPMTIKMADEKYQIYTELAICVYPEKISKEEFETYVIQIRSRVNERFPKIRKEDVFGSSDRLVGNSFSNNLNKYGKTLTKELQSEYPWIKRIYFTSFLIQ